MYFGNGFTKRGFQYYTAYSRFDVEGSYVFIGFEVLVRIEILQ